MADAQLPELYEKRTRLHLDNVALLKSVRDSGAEYLTGEQEELYKRTDEAMEAISRNIDMREKSDRVASLLEQRQERQTADIKLAVDTRQVPSSAVALRQLRHASEDFELALRGWCMRREGRDTEPMRLAAQRIGMNLDSKELELVLPRKPLQGLSREALRDWQERAQTITTTGGGYTIPDEMMQAIEVALLWFGPMRQTSEIIRTSTGADLPWPTVNDTTQVGAILDINTVIPAQDVVFGQTVFKAFKYTSKNVLVPVELMQDNAVNLPELLGRLLGERIGRIQNTHFTTGAGTTLPFGIVVQAANSTVVGAAGGGITYANLVDLEHSVDVAYRRMGAAFMMHDFNVGRLKKLLDTAGRPIWQPADSAGMQSGAAGTLLGYPYFINNDMSTAVTTGTRAVIFGNLSSYKIREVTGISLMRMDERYADFHQTGFAAWARADGQLLNAGTNPVKYMGLTT